MKASINRNLRILSVITTLVITVFVASDILGGFSFSPSGGTYYVAADGPIATAFIMDDSGELQPTSALPRGIEVSKAFGNAESDGQNLIKVKVNSDSAVAAAGDAGSTSAVDDTEFYVSEDTLVTSRRDTVLESEVFGLASV